MTNQTRGKRWFGALSVVATIATVGHVINRVRRTGLCRLEAPCHDGSG